MKDVPKDFGILEIGIASPSTAYKIYFLHIATLNEQMIEITSDSEGRLLLPRVSSGVDIVEGPYEIAAVLASRYYINEDATISVDAVDYTCFVVKFVDILDSNGDQESFDYIKLRVD